MPVFVWKGRTLAGESQAGEIEVARAEEALEALRKKRILVTSVRPKGSGFKMPNPLGSGVSTKDLAIFTRQFATMISAGLPLVQCLDILAKQSSKPSFGRMIGEVTREVEAGATLSDALGKHRNVFDDLFRNMVAAGEAGGVLDEILMRLATYIEKADALKRKVQSAMVYPAVVLTVAMGATAFMLIFIIPTFAKMFTDFGGELPMPTRIVLALSGFLKSFWWAMLLVLVGAGVALQRYYSTENGRRVMDNAMLKIPVLGDVLLKGSVARFTRTLGTLIASGVPILSGLEITARTAGNKVISEAIMTARASIREGETVAAPLKTSGVFPPMVVQMISVGEQTGALDEMLTKIAVFYEAEVDTAVDTLTSIIEPVMIVVMGGIVGGMVVAMYLPMFKLISVVAGGHS
ncbi:MAG: type II secretion system F family protein [Candidatus Eisenbacteria bacterium]|uniref:Type II secretion system F family protein n=1 Tax=Eiseniibacteriota bacterium TaxID=2212470 RepID=A0A538SJZ0_UNCEI|nr:MAG: type II secretion system F family protein [Candidatus Eisenbacteria bacterium]